MNAPAVNLVTCPCQHCNGKIEFERDHAGTDVSCPHCGIETRLFVPHTVPPPPEKLAVQSPPKKRRKRAWGLRIVSIVFFFVGLLMTFGGCMDNIEAKSAIQQAPAYMSACSGVIVMALAAVLSGIAQVVETLGGGTE